jgi:hypothetical protein
MSFCALALLGLLLIAPNRPGNAAEAAFASATLYYDSTTQGVAVLGERNVSLRIVAADYQDMKISHAFHVICRLPPNAGLRKIGVWAAAPSHLIPSDVVAYQSFDPTYVELDIDTSYFENRTDLINATDHKIHIEFFADPGL